MCETRLSFCKCMACSNVLINMNHHLKKYIHEIQNSVKIKNDLLFNRQCYSTILILKNKIKIRMTIS